MGAPQRPAGGDPVTLADLLVDLETKVGEELQVESDRAPGAVVTAVREPVDVIDEVRVVDARDPIKVARSDLLERSAGGLGLVGHGSGRPHRLSSFRWCTQSG